MNILVVIGNYLGTEFWTHQDRIDSGADLFLYIYIFVCVCVCVCVCLSVCLSVSLSLCVSHVSV